MKISKSDQKKIIQGLQNRFLQHMQRHQGIAWADVEAKLTSSLSKCKALLMMEESGGEPDLVGYDKRTKEFLFMDCSAESPAGRRSLCYDQLALDQRKEAKPAGSAMAMAEAMGISILDEAQYRYLQSLGSFDTKTSSWILTPEPVRKLGGALFGDKRYEQVFIYHNGAQSYYAARGFRGLLRV